MQMLPYRRNTKPDDAQLADFKARRAKSTVERLLVHSRFVPSLASSDEQRRRRSIEALCWELSLSAKLGAEAFVLHAGAYSPEENFKKGNSLFVDAVAQATEESRVSVPVYIENVPGGGRRMGGTLEELAELFAALGKKIAQVGICLDTAHAWAAGYDIASAEGMLRFLAKANRLIGAEHVKCFHLNDTRALLGSNREHHWHWGDGHLKAEGLKSLLDRPEYQSALGILETPKGAGSDDRNLKFLRGLISRS